MPKYILLQIDSQYLNYLKRTMPSLSQASIDYNHQQEELIIHQNLHYYDLMSVSNIR